MRDFKSAPRGSNTKDHWEKPHMGMYLEGFKRCQELSEEETLEYIKRNQYYYHKAYEDVKTFKDSLTRKSLLDVGCAVNNVLKYYAVHVPDMDWYGVDFTEATLYYKHLVSDIKNLHIQKLDFLEEPIPGEYGVISIMETLEHVDSSVASDFVDELLNKCEYLYISVPLDDNPNDGEHISFYKWDSFDNYNLIWKTRMHHVQIFKLKGNLT